eukprot:CAMPEP_0195278418 /NCGR_PEP_ID=MMETSP0706-20130129/19801_1 /TAXON_ID=33640 /ORGANISM="Asterionellopsis glacialis, Strain CCMP134" /LENGTH=59 /DNA_ID=CAMNT_0040336611 /DNA_START=38 /DNA_END=214 /DNA_ORIENTATION=-
MASDASLQLNRTSSNVPLVAVCLLIALVAIGIMVNINVDSVMSTFELEKRTEARVPAFM